MNISNGVYWVGVVDWNMRTFHGHTYTTKTGIKIMQTPLAIKYVPDENESQRCYEYGKEFAKNIK